MSGFAGFLVYCGRKFLAKVRLSVLGQLLFDVSAFVLCASLTATELPKTSLMALRMPLPPSQRGHLSLKKTSINQVAEQLSADT
ncbi:MAG: hypothetical protein IPP57_20450 [Candidatus Obscuribacter sp.]|nr:hypothetical protein [Candidatus Obscuribacter sp.]